MKSVRMFFFLCLLLSNECQTITFNLFLKSGAKVEKQKGSSNKSFNNP